MKINSITDITPDNKISPKNICIDLCCGKKHFINLNSELNIIWKSKDITQDIINEFRAYKEKQFTSIK